MRAGFMCGWRVYRGLDGACSFLVAGELNLDERVGSMNLRCAVGHTYAQLAGCNALPDFRSSRRTVSVVPCGKGSNWRTPRVR